MLCTVHYSLTTSLFQQCEENGKQYSASFIHPVLTDALIIPHKQRKKPLEMVSHYGMVFIYSACLPYQNTKVC